MPNISSLQQQPIDPNLIKEFPLKKITGPGVVLLVGMIIMGVIFCWLYTVNSTTGRIDGFPTTSAWWTYFIAYLVMTAVYLYLSILHYRKNIRKVE